MTEGGLSGHDAGTFLEAFGYTREKLALHDEFFEKIIHEFGLTRVDADVIAVLHILPDAIPFTRAFQSIANVNTIISKPKSINSRSYEYLSNLPFRRLDRQNIQEVISEIRRATVFLDIGGYFSDVAEQISQTVGENFYGVVEDAENGVQKYENKGINFPFVSVARSPLKENEDTMVGQAIAFSEEAILREHNIVFNGLQVGVVGYGKVGRSVAHNIEQKQGKVSVYDLDNIRLTHAVSAGFNVIEKASVLGESDVICLATGNRSLSGEEYTGLKRGSWVFSVTSSDDELDKEWLEDNYGKELISQYVTRYSRGNHYFYMLNEGNAINFIHGTTVGDFILLVHAELLIAAHRLMTRRVGIGEHEIDGRTRNRICGVWLAHFRMRKRKL